MSEDRRVAQTRAAVGDGSIRLGTAGADRPSSTAGMLRLRPPCRSPRRQSCSVERRYLTVGGCGNQWPPIIFSNCVMGELTLAVSDLDNLFHAWREVRSHVARTAWQHITSEMHEIDAAPLRVLLEIQATLKITLINFPKNTVIQNARAVVHGAESSSIPSATVSCNELS